MTRMTVFIAALMLGATLPPQKGEAQVLLQPGVRVRLQGPGNDSAVTGRLVSSKSDSVSFRADARQPFSAPQHWESLAPSLAW